MEDLALQPAPVPHMTPDEFRRHGAEVVEWIARYLERIEELPVLSRVAPGEVRALLPPHPPEEGERSFAAMLADVDRIVVPGITHWQSPGFFAYFPGNGSGPGILGDLLSAGLGVQGMLWSTSPACTEVETHMMDWLVEALGLPAAFRSDGPGGGVIQDTASSAVLCAILAARERTTGGTSNARGCDGSLTVYCSTQTHSSVEKGVAVAGIGRDNLRAIEVDAAFAMRPDALAAAIAADRAAGKQPSCVVATVGSTSSNAIDPVAAIAEVCQREGVWLHVDAAMSGTAALCPELRWIHDGVEHADSYCFNPHKWMLTTFDCSAFWVRDRKPLLAALSILPEYLRNAASSQRRGDRLPRLAHPARPTFPRPQALVRTALVRAWRACARWCGSTWPLAQRFASWVEADPDWELAAPIPLNLVCFRHRGGDEINQRAMDAVNASGEAYLTHTKLNGKLTLRLCVGQARTEQRHVERAWELLREAARRNAG